MIFSLPSYRRLWEAHLHRLRTDGEPQTSTRAARMVINLLLLAGLWGLPYYLRSLVASSPADSIDPHEAIIGKWQHVDDRGYVLEFTRDGAIHLSLGGRVKWTAHYRFNKWDDVVIYDINPPLVIDHREEARAQCRYRFHFSKDGFSVTDRAWEFDELWRGPEHGRTPSPFIILPNNFKRVN